MKHKKTLLILSLAFVFLLGGAYALYAGLGEAQAPNRLSVPTLNAGDHNALLSGADKDAVVPPVEEPIEPDVPPVEEPAQPDVPPVEEPVEPDVPPVEEPVEPDVPPVEEPIEPDVPPVEEPVEPDVPPVEEPIEPDVPPVEEPSEPDVPPVEEPAQPDVPPVEEPVEPDVLPRSEPRAPDFTVYDAQGKAVQLSDYIGKPIVLNFWASWCPPCQREMPAFQQKYLAYGDEVHFLMVNMTTGRETVTSATSFLTKKGYTFPVFFDTASSAARAYSVHSLPTTYFIDAEGYLIVQAIGAIDAQTLQQGIDLIR